MLALRPAGPEDENRLLTWRNDPSTREASFTQKEVPAGEHRAWLARKLRDPGCVLLIIEEDGRPLGQVRLDRLTTELAEISIVLAPEARGRGLGRRALVLAAEEAPRLLGIATLRALVKHGNEQSLRAFRAAGFVETGEVDGAFELRRQANEETDRAEVVIPGRISRWREHRRGDIHLRSEPQMLQYRAIACRLARDRAGRVLDWGCGFGQVTRLLMREGLDVIAFDYRPDIEEDGVYPLEHFPEVEAYLSADAILLPYEDESFESVLSCGVLEHVRDPDASLEEIRRVLRPGGTFYVYNLANRYSYLEKVAKVLGLHYHGVEPDDQLYSKRSAVALLERHRFRIREFRRANMLPLSLSGRLATAVAPAIWGVNRALERIPGLNLVATSLELVATSSR